MNHETENSMLFDPYEPSPEPDEDALYEEWRQRQIDLNRTLVDITLSLKGLKPKSQAE